ncbi:choice-of-anchor I family protein [bacterium SCSIO 12741]|nr:choice-of-anchor I family protein [bacterium SCSIO 12741]
MKRFLFPLKTILSVALLSTAFSMQAQVTYTLQILHASDLEGGVEAIDRAKYFAAIVDTLEGEYSNTVILSAGDNYIPGPFFNAAGDRSVFRDGGVFNNLYNLIYGTSAYNGLREGPGRADISIMNAIGFDASAVGNHEFDGGADMMESIIEEDFRSPAGPASDRWVGAQFPYLSANLDFTGSADLGNLYAGSVLENTEFLSGPAQSQTGSSSFLKLASATYITRGGEKIGVIGATTPRLEIISSPGEVMVKNPGAGMDNMKDMATHIQPWIDSLTNNHGINKIILVTHMQQIQLEEMLAGELKGVDVIIAGGSDAILANPGDRLNPGDMPYKGYPIITKNKDGDDCAIVSTDGEYSYVGRLVAGFDANGKLVPSSIKGAESHPYIADSIEVAKAWGNYSAAFASATAKGNLVDSVTQAVTGVVIAKDGNTFGKTEVFLNGQREYVRTQETNFGNLSADANLWQAQQFDSKVAVSIKNGGGIRAAIGEVNEVAPGVYEYLPPQENPLSGKKEEEVSQLDIENSLRFNNRLSVMDVTANGLKQILEHGVSAWAPGATPGQFCQVGGVAFSFDPSLAGGSRIQSMILYDDKGDVTDTIVKGGNVYGNPNRTIKVVTLNFIAGGGDGYPFPTLGSNRVDLDTAGLPAGSATFTTAGSEQDALAEYLVSEFSSKGYKEEDTDVEEDERIQILSERADGIFGCYVTFEGDYTSVMEDAGAVTIELEYDNSSSTDRTINVNVVNAISTATGSDYTFTTASGIAKAETKGVINLTLTVTEESMAESDELIVLEIEESKDYIVDPGDILYHAFFIRDNDNKGPSASQTIELRPMGSYQGLTSGSTEILDYDQASKRMFVTNASQDRFEILDFSDPMNITKVDSIDISSMGAINSLSVYDGIVAVAIEDASTMNAGKVAFYDVDGKALSNVTVGVLPDMVTFTHDGKKVVAACEGEPNDDYDQDPEGSIAIIDMSAGAANLTQADVTLLDFNAYDAQKDQLIQNGIRIFGPNASVSQDMEPEYVAISEDNSKAYVACQENNALVVVDLTSNSITDIHPLGWKDHTAAGNGLDSDRKSDDINIANAPFRGLYLPDAIAAYSVIGIDYVVTANEGDSRDYDGYSEEERLDPDDYELDETVFPDAEAIYSAYGDIKVTTANGDIDGDGDYDQIYTYGARSFSIWNATTGSLVYDSGDDFEQIISNHPEYSKFFNTSKDGLTIKNRSDDKGPEPEAVILASISGNTYAFVGMERTGGVMVYDITNPQQASFVDVNIMRDTATGDGDLGPEGLVFIPYTNSPNDKNLLVASNEVSSTLSIWEVFDPNQPDAVNENIAENNGLVIYPNPANGQVFIASQEGSIERIELFDLKGRMITSSEVNAVTHTLNLDNVPANVYLLSVHTAEGVKTSRLVIQ